MLGIILEETVHELRHGLIHLARQASQCLSGRLAASLDVVGSLFGLKTYEFPRNSEPKHQNKDVFQSLSRMYGL